MSMGEKTMLNRLSEALINLWMGVVKAETYHATTRQASFLGLTTTVKRHIWGADRSWMYMLVLTTGVWELYVDVLIQPLYNPGCNRFNGVHMTAPHFSNAHDEKELVSGVATPSRL